MKIVLKGVPPSLNVTAGRTNVWTYRDKKAEWTHRVWAACMASGERPKAPPAFAIVRIDYYFDSARRHDADNYSGKYLLDGLTKAGVIMDDDFGHICLSVNGHTDRADPRTEIRVVEAEPNE